MLNQGIIEESSSPWMAPIVFVHKKSGEIRLCVDYRKLNKKMTKNAYPLPLPDKVQECLAGSTIFSTLDLQCGYWQMPVHSDGSLSIHLDAIWPNRCTKFLPTINGQDIPRHAIRYHIHRRCASTFSNRGAPPAPSEGGFSTIEGGRIDSTWKEVPHRNFRSSLPGSHILGNTGIAPDQKMVQAVQAVQEWPVPTDATEVRRFLGLASYYRHYVHQFSYITAPLHSLTQKGVQFTWTSEYQSAFSTLNERLMQAPILAYPRFDSFLLQTDARTVGIGAVLEQDGHVVAYASRTLTKGEQKEYDFTIVYRKGSLNTVADTLSQCVQPEVPSAATQLCTDRDKEEMHRAQHSDPVIKVIAEALHQSSVQPKGRKWHQPPLISYRRMWPQLTLVDGIVCRKYSPGPTSDTITVPILPPSLQLDALHRSHDAPAAGHQGIEKTLERLRQKAYWVNMSQDVEKHCRECQKCQQSKLTSPTRAPLVSAPIGKPWEMVAVDIMEVPILYKGNCYLLVISYPGLFHQVGRCYSSL